MSYEHTCTVLMVSSIETMYTSLAHGFNNWIIFGLLN